MAETIAQLQQQLDDLSGAARVPALVRLGVEFGTRYWTAGPGSPAALGALSEAIQAWGEAHSLLDARDPVHRKVDFSLGMLLSARYGVHGGDQADWARAVELLADALSGPGLSPTRATVASWSLGQLHLFHAMESMTPAAVRSGLRSPSTTGLADLDEAIRRFRAVLDSRSTSVQLTTLTEKMLAVAEAVSPLLAGNQAGMDLGRLVAVMATFAELQQGGLWAPELGLPSLMSFDPEQVDPIDYPVLYLDDDAGGPSAIPERPQRAAPAPPVTAGSAGLAARSRLAGLVDNPHDPVWEQARRLLRIEPGLLDIAGLDGYVGAAANAVDAAADTDALESGLDCLLSAVGLCVRERRDGNGWGDATAPGGLAAAAELLVRASTGIPSAHPAAGVVVEGLAGLLDVDRPLAGAIAKVAGPLGEYADGVMPASATVGALGELCRAVTGLAAGAEVDPEPLATAVSAMPAAQPWREVLSTAVGQLRLMAAVRGGSPVAVAPDPDGLASLLAARLAGNTEALRATLDALAKAELPARVAAVAGAGYLELANHAPEDERADLATAIGLLGIAAEMLDDADQGLLARTRWRLAEAYRKRGAPMDVERSRDQGLQALSSGGLHPGSAAQFAGWMLADRCAPAAYTALEFAAIDIDPSTASTDPLAMDICNVILGIAPAVVAPPDVPAWSEVAAAVRRVGASALLYLHPSDDVGRTAGVLCLEPGTPGLDVVANVPVTDLLSSDDPGWSAIAGRWSSGGLLLAVTGDLHRLALPAMLTDGGRRLAQDVSVAHISSGRQLLDLVGRNATRVGDNPVFVVNPRGDRDPEMADVMVLRRLFYPRSACFGRALEASDGAGTRQDLLHRLPNASLVHLACGLRGARLQLVGEQTLELAAVRGNGLVILAEPPADGLDRAADEFLGAGFSGVIGWQWSVPVSFAAVALFMTHLMLVDHQLPPATAVAAVQRWMLDPDRELPSALPGGYQRIVDTTDLTRPGLWAALAYHGC